MDGISGEAPKHDVEMADAVIEVIAKASQTGFEDDLNPIWAQSGEKLPLDVERNFSGFLVKKEVVTFKIDSQKLLKHIVNLKDQLVITKLVGPKPNSYILMNLALFRVTTLMPMSIGLE